MITPVVMPQLGLEVTEGTVVAIHVAVGDLVAEGDALLELETDKALTDVVAPRAGVVARIEVELADTVPLGAPLLLLADDVDETAATPAAPQSAPAPAAPVNRSDRVAVGVGAHAGPARNEHGRIRSAPVARRAAERLGLELAAITGTGPRGRITLADVEQAAGAQAARAAAARSGHAMPKHPDDRSPARNALDCELIRLTGVRRAIARRMTQSQAIPQFSLRRQLDATRLLADKAALPAPVEGAPKVTLNDMLVQALGEIVLRHPRLALSYAENDAGDAMLAQRSAADVGLAVATDRGLLVPVVRAAHERSLRELAAERVRLVGAARSGRLATEEMRGATVTLSNLGSFGIDGFVAMLNPGEAAILAVGRTIERVVPCGRGIAIVSTLELSLTIDHRVMDGADGASALVELSELLEGAMTWRP